MKPGLKFLTSLKTAIVLLILIIGASILGTLIPQGRTASEYAARYGGLGPILQALRLTGLYHSFWYLALLILFGLNLLACTLKRFPAKMRRAFSVNLESESKPSLWPPAKERFKTVLPLERAREAAERELRARRYRVNGRSEGRRVFLSGRKRTLGFFGSDIVHFGILIILAGGIASGSAGFKSELSLFENQTRAVPRTDFSLRLDKFETEYYPDGRVRDWKSSLTVIEAGEPRLSRTIEVNHPLAHGGFLFYQSAYGWDWDSAKVELWAKKKSDPAYLKKVEIQTGGRAGLDGGLELVAARFIPDFAIDENNNPSTRSLEPNNPAVYLEGWESGLKVFSGWVFSRFPDFSNIHGDKAADLVFELKSFTGSQYSVIQMARDPGVPFIWLGSIILMAGLFISFYWDPRGIRLALEENQGKTEMAAVVLSPGKREADQAEWTLMTAALRRLK